MSKPTLYVGADTIFKLEDNCINDNELKKKIKKYEKIIKKIKKLLEEIK